MVRAPCCEKMGLKKGPWTREEDQILISYIQNYGYANWRALPKQAGLLRCGKSCRLRWMNYLRPDIRRGNFSREEEETIIKLHELLGNRWSAIAARLPGRTDNEIKNVWHTHLKKTLKQNQLQAINPTTPKIESNIARESESADSNSNAAGIESPWYASSQPSSSDISSDTTTFTSGTTDQANIHMDIKAEEHTDNSSENFLEIDESFWSDALSAEHPSDFADQLQQQQQHESDHVMQNEYDYVPNIGEDMEFWYDLFIRAGTNGQELPHFDDPFWS